MTEPVTLEYIIKNQLELNLSYMPFIKNGGLFIPTSKIFHIGDKIFVNLQLPEQNATHRVEGKVVWITPKNALYQIFPGIGIQFIGENAKALHEQIKANLDNTMDVGGYTYGTAGEPEQKHNKTK